MYDFDFMLTVVYRRFRLGYYTRPTANGGGGSNCEVFEKDTEKKHGNRNNCDRNFGVCSKSVGRTFRMDWH